jgi:hypothetical protein
MANISGIESSFQDRGDFDDLKPFITQFVEGELKLPAELLFIDLFPTWIILAVYQWSRYEYAFILDPSACVCRFRQLHADAEKGGK